MLIVSARPRQDTTVHNSMSSEPVILDVRVGSITSATMPARRVNDTAFLPVAQVRSLAGLPAVPTDTLYASTGELETMLRVHISVDWEELAVTIDDDGNLPVSRRARREEARRIFNLANAFPDPAGARAHATRMLPREVIIDYDVASDAIGSFAPPTVQLGIGASALRGDLSLDLSRRRSTSHVDYALSWQQDTPSRAWLAHVRAGRVELRRGSVPVYGVNLSSRSLFRAEPTPPILLDRAIANAGEVQVLRNGSLIYDDIPDAAGNAEVLIPSERGVNSLVVTTFEPSGDEHITRRYVSIDEGSLPAHTGSYELILGRCAESHCRYASEFSASVAPISRATIGFLISTLSRADTTLTASRLVLITHLRDDLNATLTYGSGDAALNLRFAPSPDLDLAISHALASVQLEGSSVAPRRSRTVATASWRADSKYAASASIDLSGIHGSDERRIRIASSAALGAVYLRPFATLTRAPGISPLTEYGIHGESPLSVLAPGARIRVGASTSSSRNAFLGASFSFAHSARLDARVDWSGSHTPRIELSIAVTSRTVRYETRSVASHDASVTTSSVSGSITAGADRHAMTFSSRQARGRAEIAGHVYIDADCNGQFSDDEATLAGVSVSIRGRFADSDSIGEYRIRDVSPFADVVLVVDSLSLPSGDLHMQPVRAVALPEGTTPIDLPVTVMNSSGGLVCRDRSVSRLPQHAQSRYSAAIHRNHFEAGLRYPNPVSDPRQTSEPRENIASERRPVAIGNLEPVIGARIDE